MESQHLIGKLFLITGGTGFLGWHIIQKLNEQGARARVFSRNPSEEFTNLNEKRSSQGLFTNEFFKGSILDQKSLQIAMEGISGVFHLAGMVVHSRLDPSKTFETNVQGTLNVLKACKTFPNIKVVYASTSGTVACSRQENIINDDNSPYCYEVVQDWPYYMSKIESEKVLIEFAKREKIEFCIMRPSMMLGPDDFYLRATKTIKSFLDQKIPFVPVGGISFLDVRDAASAFVSAMGPNGKSGETYLLTAYNGSILDFFNILQTISGVPRPSLTIPGWFSIITLYSLDFVNRRVKGKWDPSMDPVKAEMSRCWWNVDATKAIKELNFNPRPIEETINDTINSLKQLEKKIFKSKL